MAKRPSGTPLPRDWRASWSGWKVWPMLAKINQNDYEAEALAFQNAARGTFSENWQNEWRAYCRRKLVALNQPPRI